MIDHGTLAAELLAEADAILRLVAPDECPPWSAPLPLSFEALGMDAGIRPILHGFSAAGLDNFAAWHFSSPAIKSRPVFAINTSRIVEDARDQASALAIARSTAAHELAHAVARTYPDAIDDPAGFIARVTADVESATFEPRSPAAHDGRWWRRYTLLVARMIKATPDAAPLGYYAIAGVAYGFCRGGADHDHGATDAAKWLVAAASTPDYMIGPIAEVAARPCPKFDSLLAHVSHATTSAPAVAAYSS